METKSILMKLIERETEYCEGYDVGTEEYNSSFKRLLDLKKELETLEKSEVEHERKEREMKELKKDRITKNGIEIVKVGGSIMLPIIGLVAITAFEREDTFTTSLKGFVNCFIPKKL